MYRIDGYFENLFLNKYKYKSKKYFLVFYNFFSLLNELASFL